MTGHANGHDKAHHQEQEQHATSTMKPIDDTNPPLLGSRKEPVSTSTGGENLPMPADVEAATCTSNLKAGEEGGVINYLRLIVFFLTCGHILLKSVDSYGLINS